MKTEEKETKTAKGAALAKTGTTAVATIADYGEDAGRGYEGQSQADMTIPFLTVLQTNSPQITDREDCKPGMLFNTVTEEVFEGIKNGILFVPALTQHVFVEWKPRDKGGGFVKIFSPEAEEVTKAKQASKDFGKYNTPAGNDLVETFYIYAVLVEGEDTPGQPVVIGFTSTKIAIYKRWNTKVKMFQIQTPAGGKQLPPLFAHLVRLKTYKDTSNPKGDFFNFILEPAKVDLKSSLIAPGHDLLAAAKDFKQLVEQNLVKLAHDSTKKTEGAEAETGKPGRKPGEPF